MFFWWFSHQNPVKLLDPDGRDPVAGDFVSGGLAFAAGFAATKATGGSTTAAYVNGGISAAVAFTITFFDPTDTTTLGAGAVGTGEVAAVNAVRAWAVNIGGAIAADVSSQLVDIKSGKQKEFNYGSTIGSGIGAAVFGPVGSKFGQAIGKSLEQQLGKQVGSVLKELINFEVTGIPGMAPGVIGAGIGEDYNRTHPNSEKPITGENPETNKGGLRPVPLPIPPELQSKNKD